MKYLKSFNENHIIKNDWCNPLNPIYKEAFFDRGDEDEESWKDYGIQNVESTIEWFVDLPETLIIYRGLSYIEDKENVDIINSPKYTQGTSWTLNIRVAREFATCGVIFKGELNKEDVNKEYTIAQSIRYYVQDEEEISPIDNRLIKKISKLNIT